MRLDSTTSCIPNLRSYHWAITSAIPYKELSSLGFLEFAIFRVSCIYYLYNILFHYSTHAARLQLHYFNLQMHYPVLLKAKSVYTKTDCQNCILWKCITIILLCYYKAHVVSFLWHFVKFSCHKNTLKRLSILRELPIRVMLVFPCIFSSIWTFDTFWVLSTQ